MEDCRLRMRTNPFIPKWLSYRIDDRGIYRPIVLFRVFRHPSVGRRRHNNAERIDVKVSRCQS